MRPPVRIAGIGAAVVRGGPGGDAAPFPGRLADALSVLSGPDRRIRLIHRVEEAALLAAHDALVSAGRALPLRDDRVGIVLGLEEGIDGIKARHFRAILAEGPGGASPLNFPYTAPNAVAAQLAIALDARGENVTVCGGSLSGAQAVGLAVEAVREGRFPAMLAGGATSVGREFLDGLARVGRPDGGGERDGACLLLLEDGMGGRGDAEEAGAALFGYGEGAGARAIADALEACLADAGIAAGDVAAAWIASGDAAALPAPLARGGVKAFASRSPHAGFHSASFPLAIVDALRAAPAGSRDPALVVGTDCLGGAAAALVARTGDPPAGGEGEAR